MGASLEIAIARWHSVNTKLTVHFHREPIGEWICLETQTLPSPGGIGVTTSILSDLHSPFGVGAQALLIGPLPVRQPQPA